MNTAKSFGKTKVSIANLGIEGEGDLKVCKSYGQKYWMLFNLKFQKLLPKNKDLELVISTPFDGKFKAIAAYHEQNERIFKYGKLTKLED